MKPARWKMENRGKLSFEFHLSPSIVNNINHIRVQIAAKRGKIYANPQPDFQP